MVGKVRVVLLLLAAVILEPRPLPAQGSTGLEKYGWGTSRSAIAEGLVYRRCDFYMTVTTPDGNARIVCSNFVVPGVGPVYLTLDFVDDGLRGYSFAVPEARGPALRALAPDGADEHVTRVGRWTVRTEITRSNCLPRSVCLRVTAE